MKPFIVFCIILLTLMACKRQKSEEAVSPSDLYELSSTEKMKSFALDSETRYNGFYLYVFEDGGKEYLSFLNYRTNQLLFYDVRTCDFLFKVDLDSEGPNGVTTLSGYYIQDFNNIYVSSYAYPGLMKVDTNKCIVQKIPYGKTDEGYQVVPSYTPSSHPYVPPVQIGDKLYITQTMANHIYPSEKTPVSVAIDTVSKECCLLPFTYGDVFTKEQMENAQSACSRIWDGKHFIYSFQMSPDVFVTTEDHQQVKRVHIPSKYIEAISFNPLPRDQKKGPKASLEVARYGDLVYDPYRKVYYRFAYPAVELADEVDWLGRAVYGRKKCSIIILDEDFSIKGETLLPEEVYNTYVYFINKDGLYISKDYQMNYDQSEDFMTFELFDLNTH